MNNPNSPYRNRPFQTTLNAMSAEELDQRIAEKEREGFKLIRKHNYFSGRDRRYIAVVRRVS